MRAIILALVLCSPALAIQRDGSLSEDDRATLSTCTESSPCAVWSLDELKKLLEVYRRKLVESGTMCKRDFI